MTEATHMSIGDVVSLKSGGPHMVVKWIKGTPRDGYYVFCSWFGGVTLYEAEFPALSLNVEQP